MYFLEMILSALSLAMDAFAASLGIGACLGTLASSAAALRVSAACGGFQFAMPLVGWWLGSSFLDVVSGYDHWVAFALLLLVGGNMIRESFSVEDEGCPPSDPSCGLPLLTVAVATSIDALAVGVSFAAVGAPVMILASSAGAITAVFCFAGVTIGLRTADFLGRKAEFAGGLVLCLIGANILRASFAM
jgi:putative Mn2+ efflux pump MntP